MNKRKKIVVFHLLNDYSGSPHILSIVIEGLTRLGYDIELYTSLNSNGFLSGLTGINIHNVNYRFSRYRILTSIGFLIAQVRYFFIAYRYPSSNTIVYINTLLPFGAALGARLSGKPVIYHVHENPVKKNLIYKAGVLVMEKYATSIIFVSRYLRESYSLQGERIVTVSNALSEQFAKKAIASDPVLLEKSTILMISSLKKFKGIDTYVKLAAKMPQKDFVLVLNSGERDIAKYFKSTKFPANLKVFPRSGDVHNYYCSASIVMNLSDPEFCRESFGMTILEGFAYGLPAIGPCEGGPAELINSGLNGYHADTKDIEELVNLVNRILDNKDEYIRLSSNARKTAEKYSYSKMINEISMVIENV